MPKDFSMEPFFATVEAAIMGRKTLDVAAKMGGGSFGGSTMASYVVSRTLPPGERNGAHFVKQSPAVLISRIRAKPGKHIWLMGGGELARDFLKEEYLPPASRNANLRWWRTIPTFGMIHLKYRHVWKKRPRT